MTQVVVVAATVDVRQMVLYLEDDTTYEIKQGDPRLIPLLMELKPGLNAGQKVTITIPDLPHSGDHSLREFEEKTNGATRFFRVLRSKVVGLFKPTVAEPHAPSQELGIIPGGAEPADKMDSALADIIAHAEPVTDPKFDVADTKEDQTIIAVTKTDKGKPVVVPDIQKMAGHIDHANKMGNPKGMEAFMQRLGAVIAERGHSAPDLLRFMERGDLPVSDDGCILAYKVLQSMPDKPGYFVDCHTRKVQQRVGSYVCQDEKLISKNRTDECGTGLHIARRGYLGGFSGNVIVLAKIRPEDVIVVPSYDSNKIRVRGYHILSKVPKDQHGTLRNNKSMSGDALKYLENAIKGDHIGIIETVTITAARGGSFIVTPVEGASTKKPGIKAGSTGVAAVENRELPKKDALDGEKIDPVELAKEVAAVKEEQAATASLTKPQQARKLYEQGKFAELIAFKKAAKKSYTALGFTAQEESLILGSSGSPVTNGQEPAPAPTPEPTPEKEPVKMTGTRAEVARQLFDQATGTGSAEGKTPDRSRWGTLWRHQKDCKKSWAILGFTPKEVERIKTNKPDHI